MDKGQAEKDQEPEQYSPCYWSRMPSWKNMRRTPYVLMRKGVLPVLNNQKPNAYRKEIDDLCGIKKT